jgi:hypothetical protein
MPSPMGPGASHRLPTFLIIGAAKSGTSSLFSYLKQHPQIGMCTRKEPGFFAFDNRPYPYRLPRTPISRAKGTITSLARYQALYAHTRPDQARGEASHLYLTFAAEASASIKRHVPQAKLVVVLRQPADRAYSHYLMQRGRGLEPLSFGAAIAAEPARRAQGWDPDWWYSEVGRYGAQLATYRRHFPLEQMRVVLYEDLVRDPRAVLASIFAFIGVDPTFEPDTSARRNVSYWARLPALQRFLLHLMRLRKVHLGVVYDTAWRMTAWNRILAPPIPPADRQAVTSHLRQDILALQELIDRDLGHWLAA